MGVNVASIINARIVTYPACTCIWDYCIRLDAGYNIELVLEMVSIDYLDRRTFRQWLRYCARLPTNPLLPKLVTIHDFPSSLNILPIRRPRLNGDPSEGSV
jgi:hypothetical protein